MAKWVYMFTEGNATMRNLLGGKGANLAEMTSLGLPVPQGFTITTEACTQYYEDGRTINDEIMDQIMDYMKFTLNADTTSLEMQLHPASLGTLQIQIASKGGVVTANFIAQNEAVKAALESQMVQLREQFEEQGVKVEAIEVTVQTHEFEQNLEQGRGRNHQETEKKGRGRRISLGGAFNLEDQEESLTEPDMMVTGSSTVSYTA